MVSAGIVQDTGTPTEDSETREDARINTNCSLHKQKDSISDKPLNEFHEPNLFANCYPWLCPGESQKNSIRYLKPRE